MNRIIFCEGKTDAILLGYFLIHVCGFTVIKKGIYENTFGESKKLSTLGIIIPKEEDGALETALLESIRETPSDKEIVDRSTRFVTDIRSVANDYIKTDRLELKAKLATVFAIMSPEKVFGFIDELLMTTVKWEEKSTLMELFEPLIQLIGYKN